MLTEVIIPAICFLIGIWAFYLSILDYRKSRLAEKKFLKILNENKNRIYGIEKFTQQDAAHEFCLGFVDYIKFHSSVMELLANLEEDDRKRIMVGLNQSNIRGQVGYISRLFQLNGFNKEFKVV